MDKSEKLEMAMAVLDMVMVSEVSSTQDMSEEQFIALQQEFWDKYNLLELTSFYQVILWDIMKFAAAVTKLDVDDIVAAYRDKCLILWGEKSE